MNLFRVIVENQLLIYFFKLNLFVGFKVIISKNIYCSQKYRFSIKLYPKLLLLKLESLILRRLRRRRQLLGQKPTQILIRLLNILRKIIVSERVTTDLNIPRLISYLKQGNNQNQNLIIVT